MPNLTPEVDAYVAKSPEYARPILAKIRKLFHKAAPKIEEKIKWGVPSFEYKGMVGGMATFKNHVSFGFWKSKLMKDPEGIFVSDCAGSFSATKVTSVSELPPDKVIIAYVKEAVQLNEDGVQIARTKPTKREKDAVKPPPDLMAALKKNKKAAATFDGFSYSCRKEYVEWITEAKQDATRQKRIATAVEWMAEGRQRNWKYQKK